jgi:hypothetical protein
MAKAKGQTSRTCGYRGPHRLSGGGGGDRPGFRASRWANWTDPVRVGAYREDVARASGLGALARALGG